jgi:hypothetical protein
MLERLKNLKNDELFFHKIGLVGGAIVGIIIGFVVSDQADNYVEIIEEETPVNGPENA